MSDWNKKVRLASLHAKKLISQKIIRNALRGAATPITIEEIQALQVNGSLSLEVFYENIGSIFPFVLECISKGMSFPRIERLIGMKHRQISEVFLRYPRLNEEAQKARRVKTDDTLLSIMPDNILD
jgi:hypothetical protein